MRLCAWCDGPIPPEARRDAKFCSKSHRQAKWRFERRVAVARDADEVKRIAFADPPYPGLAWYYRDHKDYGGEVDHLDLLSRLQLFDGWALATNEPALPSLLELCRQLGITCRVAAWVRGARGNRSSGPLQSWEPVLYVSARSTVDDSWPSDSLVHGVRPRTTDPGNVIGAKPSAYSSWVFQLLGARRGDEFTDLFPGSGGVSRAWRAFADPSRVAGVDG